MTAVIPARAIDIARRIVERKNAAVVAGDANCARKCDKHYDRLVSALNGGTLFGSQAGPDSVGVQLNERIAAPDGTVPMWGQSGRFFIRVDGMASVVTYDAYWCMSGFEHFEFHACEFDRPYISETGYRSDFAHELSPGLTTREAAELRFRALQREGVRVIKPDAYVVQANAFGDTPFVVQGLRAGTGALPYIGEHVRVGRRVGLVVADAAANAEGRLIVAMMDCDKTGRHRNAPLTTIRHVTV
ncbi:hypothetical protein K6Y78_39175 [Burkholderia cenocepacia]|nr:hypothetical protein [Burkholderia cenocepacia]MCW3589057.1 hypothetical protein [Burkholderia cenocepacia]